MKIRNGFVSNSSSSSFAIYGFRIEGGALVDLLGLEDDGRELDYYYFSDALDCTKGVGKKFSEAELTVFAANEEHESFYVGRDWVRMKDRETLSGFKKRTEKDLRAILGKRTIPACQMLVGECYY